MAFNNEVHMKPCVHVPTVPPDDTLKHPPSRPSSPSSPNHHPSDATATCDMLVVGGVLVDTAM